MLTTDQLVTWFHRVRHRDVQSAVCCPDCRRYFDGHAEGGTDDRCCDACWAWKYGGE